MSRLMTQSAFILLAFTGAASSASSATPSTSHGQISVAQVMQMLAKAPTDKTAQQVLTAYLAGVGEAVGVAASIGDATCRVSMGLNADNVRQALKAAAAGQNPAEAPATPLIVKDMLNRAGCRRQ